MVSSMGGTCTPDVSMSSAKDNPFAAPEQQPVGNITINLPTGDWLCQKMDKLNLTLVQGYPSRSLEIGSLMRD